MKNKRLLYGMTISLLLIVCMGLCACSKPKHEHDFGKWKTVQEPTCAEEGREERECDCGEKKMRSIDKLDHTEVIDEAIEATCTTDGRTEGSHCSVCDEVIVKPKKIKAEGHTEIILEAVAPTCTEEGLTEGKGCGECGEILLAQQSIDAPGHNMGQWKVVQEAMCVGTGQERRECSNCSHYEFRSIDAKGHNMGTWHVVEKATCTSDGEEHRDCQNCSYYEWRSIEAKGHSYRAAAIKPTCTEKGYTLYTCITCQNAYKDKYVDELSHAYGSWSTRGDDTVRYCVHENCTHSQKLQSLQATYNGIRRLIGESVARTDITVTAILDDGSKVDLLAFELENVVMTRDGDNEVTVKYLTVKTTVAVPAIHDNLPGTTAISEFEYTTKNGEITITKFVGSSKDIVIPAHVDRVPVRYIWDRAFENRTDLKTVVISNNTRNIGYRTFYSCKYLTSVSIPNSLQTIGKSAFYECKSLKNLVIPSSVKTIGESAFQNCTWLETVVIGDDEEQVDLTTIGSYAFENCTSLKNVIIGNGVSTISRNAFYKCTALESVSFGDHVTYIGLQAFENCISLKAIVIPNNVNSIDQRAFYGCKSLVSVSIPNSLQTIGKSAFYECKSLKNLIIPSSVKTIGESAFGNCTGLETVVIGDDEEQVDLTTIGSYAFEKCTSLKNVIIGRAVVSIGRSAFQDCTKLTTVNYLGSETEWKSVTLGSNWNKNTGVTKITLI